MKLAVACPYRLLPLLLLVPVSLAAAAPAAAEPKQQAYNGARATEDGSEPASTPAAHDGPALTTRLTYVGREAAEPTIGVTKSGTAFYAAGTFDALPEGSPVQPARTEVLRSGDGGLTWESVQPALPVGWQRNGETTLPPFTLDPYVYVEEDTGRVFNPELYVGCSFLNYSDDEGDSWTHNPFACGQPVNDHQTLAAGPPPAGLETSGFPEVVYYCFNRVSDSSCGRSLDGGDTFTPTGSPAFFGFDSEAGGFCGGLHGHLETDSEGRVFLPKGHCDRPWVAISEDGGETWKRVKVTDEIDTFGHEATVTADSADNLYYVWYDDEHKLPWMSTSTDHGETWSEPLMIAPPGVHEVNFPVAAAGDEGRIAFTFPGTESDDRDDEFRPWNSYTVVSTNALDPDPLFVSTTANDTADPIHRGDCGSGGSSRCAGMFDFLDIVVSPADGDFWATATDTCTEELDCITKDGPEDTGDGGGATASAAGAALPKPQFHQPCEVSCSMDGAAIRQTGGPSLVE